MVPNYIRLKEILKEEIKNKFKKGDLFYSQNEIMDKYGYSYVTVIKALEELQKEGYIYRIKGKGTYISNVKIEKSEIKNIGIVFSDILSFENLSVREMIKGIEEGANGENVHFIFFPLQGRTISGEKSFLFRNAIEKRELSGIIIGDFIEKNDLFFIKESGIPVVLLFNSYEDIDVVSVLPDFEFLGEKVTEELIESGYKRIGLIIGPLSEAKKLGAISVSVLFSKGYKKSLERKGLNYDNELIKETHYRPDEGEKCMKELLSLDNPPDAVIIIDEDMAKRAKEVNQGRVYIKDSHIFSFSDREAGKKAMEILKKLMNGEVIFNNRIVIPYFETDNENKFETRFEKKVV